MRLKRHNMSYIAAVALAAALSVSSFASNPPGQPQPKPPSKAGEQKIQRQKPPAGEWLRKYRNVPADQQQKALQSDPQFQKLAPQRQQQLEQRLKNFNS